MPPNTNTATPPARRRLEFNKGMIRFYDSRDGNEMMRFMAGCSLDRGLRVHE